MTRIALESNTNRSGSLITFLDHHFSTAPPLFRNDITGKLRLTKRYLVLARNYGK